MTLADSLSVKLTAGEAVGWKEQIFSIYFFDDRTEWHLDI